VIEKTRFLDIDAVRITNGKKDEITLLSGLGPRIIQFKPGGGKNFFYVREEDFRGSAERSDAWRIFGGTRLWTSPETILSYRPDNEPCEAALTENSVTVTTPADQQSHLRKSITVEPTHRGFVVTYGLANEGPHLLQAGLWALSCLAPAHNEPSGQSERGGAAIFLPWGEDSGWNVKDMRYWRSWLGVQTDVESAQWRPSNEFFTVRPTGEVGKIGFANLNGFVLFRRGGLTFVKRSSYVDGAPYPDGGCSTEIYTSADFYEIETLSPVYLMKPGEEYFHREEWWAGYEEPPLDSITDTKAFVDSVLGRGEGRQEMV
jgi:hypothetical protein